VESVGVLGNVFITNHLEAPSFAIVDKFHVMTAVEALSVLTVT
jgi:hypothetical protein